MKSDELRKLSTDELVTKCNESLVEFKKIKFALKTGNITPENINKARELRKDIARVKTILNEMKLLEG